MSGRLQDVLVHIGAIRWRGRMLLVKEKKERSGVRFLDVGKFGGPIGAFSKVAITALQEWAKQFLVKELARQLR